MSLVADKFGEMQQAAITLREMLDDEDEIEMVEDILDISMDLGQYLIDRGEDVEIEFEEAG